MLCQQCSVVAGDTPGAKLSKSVIINSTRGTIIGAGGWSGFAKVLLCFGSDRGATLPRCFASFPKKLILTVAYSIRLRQFCFIVWWLAHGGAIPKALLGSVYVERYLLMIVIYFDKTTCDGFWCWLVRSMSVWER